MKSLPALVLVVFGFGCNAYRSAPESEVLLTPRDLANLGFVVAPVIDSALTQPSSPAELAAYDAILANILTARWPHVKLLLPSAITTSLAAGPVDTWRRELSREDASAVSISTLKVLARLDAQRIQRPHQVLLPTIVQNSVSCGTRESPETGSSVAPLPKRNYCQRLVKVRFRILDPGHSEMLWNGVVYATREASRSVPLEGDSKELEAPQTQILVRECFVNFSKQFIDEGP